MILTGTEMAQLCVHVYWGKELANRMHHCADTITQNKMKVGLVADLASVQRKTTESIIEKGQTWTQQKSQLKRAVTGFINDCLLDGADCFQFKFGKRKQTCNSLYCSATKGFVTLSAKVRAFTHKLQVTK